MTAPATITRDAIEADQLRRLRALLAELVPGNRFYTPRLRDAGLDRNIDSLDTFRKRMPLTTKHELVSDQQAHPPFGSTLSYSLDRYTRFNQTSGTTRAPLRWLDTPESWEWMLGNWQQVYRAAGVTPESRDRVYFAFSFGPFLGFWTAFDAATRLGCLAIPGGGLTSTARLHAILDNETTVLCCTPTYALRLAEVAQAEGIALSRSKVRAIIVAGEPGGGVPSVRARIERAWCGARVVDHHGMTEVGPVSYEPVDAPGSLRVIESSYLAEIIDPQTTKPTPAGEVGELVLTTLGRLGSPLLRYRTGDLVKAFAFEKHVELTLDGGILGRADDMVLVRGVNVYPSAVDQVLRGFEDVAEYRVTVRTAREMTELSIEVEGVPGCADAAGLPKRIETALRQSLNLRIPVTPAKSALPRFEMKASRWVRE